MTVQDRVRSFIVEDLQQPVSRDDLVDELLLIEAGLIDSLGVYELVGILETEFGVVVADEEVVPDNLGSIGRIARFVEAKRRA